LTAAAYVVWVAVMFLAFPANPDPVSVPIDLLQLFRTLSMIGWFLLWGLLAGCVALVLVWYQRAGARAQPAAPVRGGAAAGPARP
jgi:hypothetical protein